MLELEDSVCDALHRPGMVFVVLHRIGIWPRIKDATARHRQEQHTDVGRFLQVLRCDGDMHRSGHEQREGGRPSPRGTMRLDRGQVCRVGYWPTARAMVRPVAMIVDRGGHAQRRPQRAQGARP